MMYVDSIEWLDIDSEEAEVVISDGTFTVLCFSHPCKYVLGDVITEPLICLNEKNIVCQLEKAEYLNKNSSTYFSYEICGKYCGKGIVAVGEIIVEINENLIPKDIIEGEYIRFIVERIDV